jgi:hypothetical protein
MVDAINVQNAKIAKDLYLQTLDSIGEAEDWRLALRSARRDLAQALRASSYLFDVAQALSKDGGHMLAFRHFTSPPLSQEQFRLRCPVWSKQSEKSRKGLQMATAQVVADTFEVWRDKSIGKWLLEKRNPRLAELRELFYRASPLIAHKRIETARRNRLAQIQENSILEILTGIGWERRPSKMIDKRADLPPKTFMYKTRFATNTTAPQEVDIACGLLESYVLALECKVTNDETNSVKRINDVLKKSSSWKAHWGSFVETAALLQGVIKPTDVQRLTDQGVHVFWSHDLERFSEWISARTES